MNKEIAKKAFELAEKELKEKQIEKLKYLVKDTLKRIADIEDDVKELNEEKRLLKLDIDDLKEGRLDRIEERQKTDKRAKKVSRIVVERVEVREVHYTPIRYVEVPYKVWPNTVWYGGSTTDNIFYGTTTASGNTASFTLTGNLSKQFTPGAYELDNNHGVTHLR